MAVPVTTESKKLSGAFAILDDFSDDINLRLTVIELASSIHSGFDIESYYHSIHIDLKAVSGLEEVASSLERIISSTDVPFELAVSALAREPLSVADQKKNGVFYTDYRLSLAISEEAEQFVRKRIRVADLSAGTGILLAGIASVYKTKFQDDFDSWISECLFAYDLSDNALRGAAAAIISMTRDHAAVERMLKNWSVCDSLFSLPEGIFFDLVVGNPPWGRIKLSRPAFMARNGSRSIYGSEYTGLNLDNFKAEKDGVIAYSNAVKRRYSLLEKSEVDMYMAFIQDAIEHLAEGGKIVYLVPAGLIRSTGTEAIRNYLVENSSLLRIVLLDNHIKYFSIDSRFKFVILDSTKGDGEEPVPNIDFIISNDTQELATKPAVRFDVRTLREIRPDLSIPEVKDDASWSLFCKMCRNGVRWGQAGTIWEADFCREVDMTNDRPLFHPASDNLLPVIEGRMVQQYRFGAKRYVSGSGRGAHWVPSSSGCHPQFTIDSDDLSLRVQKRIEVDRVGFCDIVGQTNERAMMSTLIPAGVVCGNKVPTVTFPNDDTGDLKYLWIGVTNSFVFDWMVRRIVSTTVNYFHLLSLPMPSVDPKSEDAERIVELVKFLLSMESEFYSDSAMGETRAEIEVLVAKAYGLDENDLRFVFSDFPLVDKRQPKIDDAEFTCTFNLVFSKKVQTLESQRRYTQLAGEYKAQGAKAFIPSEMTELCRWFDG